MREILLSLSLGSGAVLIAVITAIGAYLAGHAWTLKAAIPFGVVLSGVASYCLYWAPTWLGADPTQAWSWAPLVIGAWCIAGSVASLGAYLVLKWRHAHRSERKASEEAHV
jgi:hypothetical protein